MCEFDTTQDQIAQQCDAFISDCDYAEFTSKFEAHRGLIDQHLAQLPEWFITEQEIFNAALISATVQATQERRTGGLTFQAHILQVAESAYDKAIALRALGQNVSPAKCAILGLIHDAIEDARKNGVDPEMVKNLIGDVLDDDINEQLKLLTMDEGLDIMDKEERDNVQTEKWLGRIPDMDMETRFVKLADIENNTDGEDLRESKRRQREEILNSLVIVK